MEAVKKIVAELAVGRFFPEVEDGSESEETHFKECGCEECWSRNLERRIVLSVGNEIYLEEMRTDLKGPVPNPDTFYRGVFGWVVRGFSLVGFFWVLGQILT